MEVMQEKQFSKTLAFKARESSNGVVSGYPAVMGNLDWDNDVILPGAFNGVLEEFLRAGAILTDHKKTIDNVVGYPTVAEEQGNKLYSEFAFHSDENSQDVRAKMKERIDAGKDVGLSVGFLTSLDNYVYHRNGSDLLDWAKSQGYDLRLFDTKAIQFHRGPCQTISKVDCLLEYSLTMWPANTQALVSAVKAQHLEPRHPEDYENIELEMCMGAVGKAYSSMCSAVGDALNDSEMDYGCKCQKLRDIHNEFTALCLDIYQAQLKGGGSEYSEPSLKEGNAVDCEIADTVSEKQVSNNDELVWNWLKFKHSTLEAL